ncbi:hypothetical protein BpHYR1_054245, partial [Brachionus plicatilis]
SKFFFTARINLVPRRSSLIKEQKNKEIIFKKYIFSLNTSSSKLFVKSHMSVLIEDRSLEECTLKLGSFLANTLPYEILACLD